jgi:hypothetical protein
VSYLSLRYGPIFCRREMIRRRLASPRAFRISSKRSLVWETLSSWLLSGVLVLSDMGQTFSTLIVNTLA